MASAPQEFTYARIDVPEGVTDLTGLDSGMLTVLWPTRGPKQDLRWMCQCECGNRKAMPGAPLRSGQAQACGCRRIKDPDGIRKTRLHGIWRNMVNRCRDITREGYGGRGIQVAEEWREYEAFQRWAMANGYADDLTIDRRNNDGNYCPANCHWTTMLAQSRNTRRTVWVEHVGRTVSLAEAAADLGISYHQLHGRVKRRGMTLAAALADIASGGCQSPGYLRMAQGLAKKRASKLAAWSSTPSIPTSGAREHESVKASEYVWSDARGSCAAAAVLADHVCGRHPAGDRAGRRHRVHAPVTYPLNLENARG